MDTSFPVRLHRRRPSRIRPRGRGGCALHLERWWLASPTVATTDLVQSAARAWPENCMSAWPRTIRFTIVSGRRSPHCTAAATISSDWRLPFGGCAVPLSNSARETSEDGRMPPALVRVSGTCASRCWTRGRYRLIEQHFARAETGGCLAQDTLPRSGSVDFAR